MEPREPRTPWTGTRCDLSQAARHQPARSLPDAPAPGSGPAKRAPRVYSLPPAAVPLLGRVRDAELAHRFGIPDDLVYRERKRRDIPKLQTKSR